MKRYPGMKLMRGVLFGLVLLAAACGGERSVASKSAAAYDEAKAKGVAVTGGHEHGGHEAGPATDADDPAHGTTADMHAGHDMTGGDMAAMDHSAHGTTGDAHAGHDMAAMDHSAMDHGTAANAHAGHQMQSGMTMDHSAHGATADAHAGHDMTAMDHSAMDHAARGQDMSASNAHAQHGSTSGASGSHASHDMPAMTAEQHAAMQQGAAASGADAHAGHTQTMTGMAGMDHSQHGATATAATPIAATAPRSTADVRSIQPSSTLQPDAFDAPAPISVNEAAKAGQGGGHEGHAMRGITPGEDRENPPAPMPAIRDGSNAKPAPPPHDHHGGH